MIYTCRFHHPQENLRAYRSRGASPEAEFAGLFSRCYQGSFLRIHSGTAKSQTLFVREVPVHGNGIADLVVLSWSSDKASRKKGCLDLAETNPTIRAFELKMSDWRHGLMQAHRYKYFSDVSVLVLPRSKLGPPTTHLDLFRTLRVGLWGFDPESRTVLTVHTPRPKRQHIAKYRDRALELVLQAARS